MNGLKLAFTYLMAIDTDKIGSACEKKGKDADLHDEWFCDFMRHPMNLNWKWQRQMTMSLPWSKFAF